MYMLDFAKTVMDMFDWNEMKHSVKSAKRFHRSSAFGCQKVYQVIDVRV